MSKVSKKELAIALEEKRYWQKIGEPAGWRLMGWTYKDSALFVIPNTPYGGRTVNVTSDHVSLINDHLYNAKCR